MRSDGPIARTIASVVTVLLSIGLVGCDRGPQIVTSIEFDGESASIATHTWSVLSNPLGAWSSWWTADQSEWFEFNSRSRAD
jgi:hypothetical protein